MARQTLYDAGGRPLLIRAEPLAQIDQLAEEINLYATQGVRRGMTDRVGAIELAVSAVLEEPAVLDKLRVKVAELTAERERAEAASPRRRKAAEARAAAGRTVDGRTRGDRR